MEIRSFILLYILLVPALVLSQAGDGEKPSMHEFGLYVGTSMYQFQQVDSGKYHLQSVPANVGMKYFFRQQPRLNVGIGIAISQYHFSLNRNQVQVSASTILSKRVYYLDFQFPYEFNILLRESWTVYAPATIELGFLVGGSSIRRGTWPNPNFPKQFRSLTASILLGIGARWKIHSKFSLDLNGGGRLPLSEVSKGDGHLPLGYYGTLGARFPF